MDREKKTGHNAEKSGQLCGDDIPFKKCRFDFWYPKIMTVLLALNLLLQILVLVLRW